MTLNTREKFGRRMYSYAWAIGAVRAYMAVDEMKCRYLIPIIMLAMDCNRGFHVSDLIRNDTSLT
jgi:hypothetical protein